MPLVRLLPLPDLPRSLMTFLPSIRRAFFAGLHRFLFDLGQNELRQFRRRDAVRSGAQIGQMNVVNRYSRRPLSHARHVDIDVHFGSTDQEIVYLELLVRFLLRLVGCWFRSRPGSMSAGWFR